MPTVDQFFLDLHKSQVIEESLIACFYRGKEPPSYCHAMPRSPVPDAGHPLDSNFTCYLLKAMAANAALHDGALMFGRSSKAEDYILTGWSYRLFPPATGAEGLTNRGSAFNSCLAMSQVGRVDRLLLLSRDGVTEFKRGDIKKLA
ncbi:hypothetical protein [Methyloligella halotolerans]|uniref:hypothetical protein n=1 Tax=Methyloligella halotolerans TaxID=1177755 RepID=UPI00114C9E28|nr:hypothetical protein [Methyloligella halotolerans]